MKFMFIVQKEFIKLECQEKEYLESGANVWSKFLEKKRGKKKTYTMFLYWLKVVVTQLFYFFVKKKKKVEKGLSQSPKF